MSSSTATASRPARGAAPAWLRAALTRLSERLHAAGDARARAMGWTVTTVPGPLGLAGRAYRHHGFRPRAAGRRGEHGPGTERRLWHPRAAGGSLAVAARPGRSGGRKDTADA
jgi:hypothetical protein